MKALVAGIGNVFFGDDGFGVEVASRLAALDLPGNPRVRDFGVRGIHLAYELLEPMDLLVLIDLTPRGEEPGTLYEIDPQLEGIENATADPHGMNLPAVFATVNALGGSLPRVRVIGCEPGTVEEGMGLSAPVARAVEGAVNLVCRLLERELSLAGR